MNHNDPKKTISLRQFLLQYILPLFLAVLVLVLISYFNEMTSQETQKQLESLRKDLTECETHISGLESRVAALEDAQKTTAVTVTTASP